VINDDVHVKKETRERVISTMQRLGFVANRQARSLAGGKSHSIGVLVPDLGTGYIGEIIRGIDAELSLTDLDLNLYTTHRTASKEASFMLPTLPRAWWMGCCWCYRAARWILLEI
jgi:LacI family transcriptional regulator